QMSEKQIQSAHPVATDRPSTHTISAHNGILIHRTATIPFDVSAMLEDGELTEVSPFTPRFHVRQAELEQVQSLLGYNYPVSGRLDLSLNASGSRLNPHGDGQLQLTNASLYGQQVPRLICAL